MTRLLTNWEFVKLFLADHIGGGGVVENFSPSNVNYYYTSNPKYSYPSNLKYAYSSNLKYSYPSNLIHGIKI